MEIYRTALGAAALACLACSGGASAQAIDCDKNHYILDFQCAGPTLAQPTFKITEVFSNLDGSVQFIELTETAGLNGQHHFAGLVLTSTHNGVAKAFVFPRDLETDQTAHMKVVVAAAPDHGAGPVIFSALIGNNFGQVITYRAEFNIPPRFLPTDGGTIDFAGADQWTYDRLPTNGALGLYRNTGVAKALLPRGVCPGAPPSCPTFSPLVPAPVDAVEYYDAARDHYFISASAPDIDALDSGRVSGWQRTGETFGVGVDRVSNIGIEWKYLGLPVCRVYIPPALGDSHFFSASPDECTTAVQRYPGFVLETAAAFYAALPDPVTGACGALPGIVDGDWELHPVYRLWNQRLDSNHRLTTSLQIRAEMIARGWVPEGAGPLGVAMCAL